MKLLLPAFVLLLLSCNNSKTTQATRDLSGYWILDSIENQSLLFKHDEIFITGNGKFYRFNSNRPITLIDSALTIDQYNILKHGRQVFTVDSFDSTHMILLDKGHKKYFLLRLFKASDPEFNETLKTNFVNDSLKRLADGQWQLKNPQNHKIMFLNKTRVEKIEMNLESNGNLEFYSDNIHEPFIKGKWKMRKPELIFKYDSSLYMIEFLSIGRKELQLRVSDTVLVFNRKP